MYDGFRKYGKKEAQDYELERKKEPIWWAETAYMENYFSCYQPKSLLDAPVGTGRFLDLYREIPEVVGIDISTEMLKQSAEKVGFLNRAAINLQRGDIFNLDFPSGKFEVTVCWRFAHLVPPELLVNALREIGRVTSGEVLLQAYIGPPYWRRVINSVGRLPVKLFRKIIGMQRVAHPWAHIRAYFHTDKILHENIAQAGLSVSSKVVIGRYNESLVCVYQLKKA